MSINSLTLQSNGALPFLPLDGETVVSNPVIISTNWYPLEKGSLSQAKSSYEGSIKMKCMLFVTSQRLIFINCNPAHSLKNAVVLYRQVMPQASGEGPISLTMPYFGSNYLKLAFKILPEQAETNGQWLNFMYTWLCEIYLEKGAQSIKDIFQLHDAIKFAIISRGQSDNEVPADDEALPRYSP